MISPAHVNERGIDIVRPFHCWISLQLHSAVVNCSREQLEPLITGAYSQGWMFLNLLWLTLQERVAASLAGLGNLSSD